MYILKDIIYIPRARQSQFGLLFYAVLIFFKCDNYFITWSEENVYFILCFATYEIYIYHSTQLNWCHIYSIHVIVIYQMVTIKGDLSVEIGNFYDDSDYQTNVWYH